MSYTVLSLFSGCGGLDLGLQGGFRFLDKHFSKNNFKIIWSNDIDKNACQTYQNYFDHPIICGDIREILSNNHTGMFNNPMPLKSDIVAYVNKLKTNSKIKKIYKNPTFIQK